jgi:beta-galactosidase
MGVMRRAAAASTLVTAINCGGGASGLYVADKDSSGGSAYSSGAAVSTGTIVNPAPQAVYQSERFGNFTYTIPGLSAGATYIVRLHFAEIYWGAVAGGGAGSRVFNVSINGTQVLSNFDIYATAGGANRAVVRQFTAVAGGGSIAITFTTLVDNAKCSGIEVYTGGPVLNDTPAGGAPAVATTLTGSGFTASRVVPVYWDSTSSSQLGSATTDGAGNLSAPLSIPAGTTTGLHTIIAVDPVQGAISVGYFVTGGAFSLAVPASASFPAVTLTGAAQSVSVAVTPLVVTDERGTGAGWTLSAQAPDLMNGAGRAIGFASMSVTSGGTASAAAGSLNPAALVTAAGAALGGADTTPGVTYSASSALLTAPANQGMGRYTTSAAVSLSVPARAYNGSYTTSLVFVLQ